MTRCLLAASALALVLAMPAGAARAGGSTSGVVVGVQHGLLLVASPAGLVQTVSGRASIGTRVLVSGSRLMRTLGRTRHALIEGVVVRRSGRMMFLSAAHHLLVIHTSARRPASLADAPPAPGSVVQTTVAIDDQGELDDQGDHQLGQSGQIQVQAVVNAVGTGTVTLTVNGQLLTIPLPAGLTLPASLIGTQVTLNISFANGQAQASGDEQGDDNDQGDNGDSGSDSGD
jgi:hypothetical protein